MMRRISALMFCLLATSFSALQAQQQSPGAQAGPAHAAYQSNQVVEAGPLGGVLQTVGSHRVETVLRDNGVMFMLYTADGQVVQAPAASGSLTLKVGENPKAHSFKLQTLKNHGWGAAIDLSKLDGKTLHLEVELSGVASQPLKFQATGKLGGVISDALLVSLQKTCPVSGQPLGSMGKPPKVMVKGKPIFICCASCSGKVTANPEAFLAKVYQAKGKEVRPGVFESTLADADAIAAQKKCAVMDEELGGMGVPQKVRVDGKSVYICCVGCAKKLQTDPEKFLAKLAEQGVTPPEFE